MNFLMIPIAFASAFLTALFLSFGVAQAQSADLDTLFEQLADAEGEEMNRIEGEIWAEWSKSGSPSMDLLLTRGRMAMEVGEYSVAVEHFTALIDHAPDFAEGWNARATAYYNMGQFGPSIDDIAHVLSLNPRHFGALSGLASILEQIGHPEDALKALQEVKSIHPHRDGLEDEMKRLEKEIGGATL
jgi:tetratricopeptide (TPR) repeat protein